MFADLFPTNRGRPSVPADVIATVMVLQSLEGLSDREAVRALDYRDGYKAHVATEVLGDSAYGADEFRSHLKNNKMTAVIKPPPLRPAVTGGFSLDDFAIDLDAGTVTCPEEITPTPAPRAPLLSTVLDATSTRGAPSSPL